MRLMARVTDRLLNRLVPVSSAQAMACVRTRICYSCIGGWQQCCVYYDGTGQCPPKSCSNQRC